MNLWVYDLETYPNFFLACFYNVKTKEWRIYEISDRKNHLEYLYKFLTEEKPKLIGFNNVNFDYPILHNTILKGYNPSLVAMDFYMEAQRTIKVKYSAIWDNQVLLPQLDLFKIWHYDNKNKSTSLKWLEFAMRSNDVRDLPYHHTTKLNSKQMDEVVSYCKHDVLETYKFYTKSDKHIKIREFYSQLENINLMNASETKMAKEIFTKHLANELNVPPSIVRKLRTHRTSVDIKDVIFDYIKFEDKTNIKALETFKSSTWLHTEGMTKKQKEEASISFSLPYNNVIRVYGEGGLHSFPGYYDHKDDIENIPSIFESNDDYVLLDLDFASFYPHISFKHNLHPEHIPGKIFNELYEGFYIERKNYPKSDPRNYVLKIVLNSSYGLSKDKYSMLYDPKWQLSITINGQLLLTLLTEKVLKYCEKEVRIVFENTDGAMYFIHRSDISNVNKAAKEVETTCNIPLETQECKKIIARDVNNYINIIDDGYIKFKGAFEIDRDYHKNHSKRIVPIAVANYFLNGVAVSDTIKNHLNGTSYEFAQNFGIYDFCLGAKMTGSNKLYKREVIGQENFKKSEKREFVELFGYTEIARDFYAKNYKGAKLDDVFDICYEQSTLKKDTELSKTTRYYVSNNGYQLIKKMPYLARKYNNYVKKYISTFSTKYPKEDFSIVKDIEIELPHRETNIESGQLCTVFNKAIDADYDINYQYYINECNKIIELYE